MIQTIIVQNVTFQIEQIEKNQKIYSIPCCQ